MSIQQRTFTFPQSGEVITYELERKNVKNFNLRMRRDGTLHLSVPIGTTVSSVEAFLAKEEGWFMAARERITAREAAHPDSERLAAGDTLPYLGGTVHVRYEKSTGTRASFVFDEATLTLTVRVPDPTDDDWRVPAIEYFEKYRTSVIVEPLIRKYLPYVTKKGATAPRSIHYKRMVSRHGSCTASTGSLSFNTRLCEYPMPFIEYVVVHELCHLLQQNHSAAFYREVEAILPDWREREKAGTENGQGGKDV